MRPNASAQGSTARGPIRLAAASANSMSVAAHTHTHVRIVYVCVLHGTLFMLS